MMVTCMLINKDCEQLPAGSSRLLRACSSLMLCTDMTDVLRWRCQGWLSVASRIKCHCMAGQH